jgi:hypothetical protein
MLMLMLQLSLLSVLLPWPLLSEDHPKPGTKLLVFSELWLPSRFDSLRLIPMLAVDIYRASDYLERTEASWIPFPSRVCRNRGLLRFRRVLGSVRKKHKITDTPLHISPPTCIPTYTHALAYTPMG